MPDQRHILVVDDEPQITRVLRTSLSAQGYDIRVANSGEMALEIMKDWQPNLIITDLSMPSIDGVELCRTVRAVSIENRAKATAMKLERDLPATLVNRRIAFVRAF
jgi:CheY-like chemotaxis protein